MALKTLVFFFSFFYTILKGTSHITHNSNRVGVLFKFRKFTRWGWWHFCKCIKWIIHVIKWENRYRCCFCSINWQGALKKRVPGFWQQWQHTGINTHIHTHTHKLMHKLNLFIHMLTGFNHLLLIHTKLFRGFLFLTDVTALCLPQSVCHAVMLPSYQPSTPPSIHLAIHPSLSIHPKAFQQVQPCGKQGNHVKWTADSSNYCGRAPSRWLSSSQTIC